MDVLLFVLAVMLVGLALLVLGASLIYMGQVLASLMPAQALAQTPGQTPSPQQAAPSTAQGLRWAVIVPAHNESSGLTPTLLNLLTQVSRPQDIVVVAHNCNDDTAAIARQAGVSVVVLNNPLERGKGYALQAGVRSLEGQALDAVVIFDADCLVATGRLAEVAHRAHLLSRPVQANYLMSLPDAGTPLERINAFAWIVRNGVRPTGMARLGLPCQIMGSGFALPWSLAQRAPLGSADIVEDLSLGLYCAQQGAAPVFLPEVVVQSFFPTSQASKDVQKSRWETGHVQTLLRRAPTLIIRSLVSGNGGLFALALDMAVPPLALLATLLMLVLLVAVLAATLTGFWLALAIALVAALAMGVATCLAWWACGRGVLPGRDFARIPFYVLRKLPRYLRAMAMRPMDWIRADRSRKP